MFKKMMRLKSATKVWKVFTNMLQSKLHKLNKSRAIKKPPHRAQLNKTSKKVSWPTFSLQPRRQRTKKVHSRSSHKLRHHQHHSNCYLRSRPSPVYIDQLFLEPIINKHEQPPAKKVITNGSYKEICSSSAKKDHQIDGHESMPGTSDHNERENEMMHTADDMWESFLLASPQMHGIDERAEEFITRFRAEMQLQEMLARQ